MPESAGDQEEQYPDTPAGWAARFKMEMDAAHKEIDPWHLRAEKILRRYTDDRKDDLLSKNKNKQNYFAANLQTTQALLYGKTPQVDVSRRFADAQDDVARVAGEILERLLNTDIARDNDAYATVIGEALFDLLSVGIGMGRCRYVADFEQADDTPAIIDDAGTELAPAVPGEEQKTREDVEVDYVYWRDNLWSPARTFHEVRWWAFRAEMSRKQLIERFGEDVARPVPLNAKRSAVGSSDTADANKHDPWSRAEVWEIWDKEHKQVLWYVDGYSATLDIKPDPLGLEAFWPFPRPLMANLTTSALLPLPDYALAQDLYEEIDFVSSRISQLEKSIRVVGVYDKTNDGLKRLVSEARENEMIAVENWAMFAEKGGIDGAVSWFPLKQIVEAMDKLREYRTELVQTMYQLTGMSDIMRGQAASAATATEQSIKARFASVRVQSRQDELARFASDIQRIKAEIIAKHFEPQTILDRSNIAQSFDAQLAGQAIELIKSKVAAYRVEVKPEAISLTDFAAMKNERTEVMQALGAFLPQIMQAATAMPAAMPFFLQILQWFFAGIRGAKGMEGLLDQAIATAQQQAKQQAQQPKPPPPPDPKIVAAQMAQQTAQMKAQADAQHTQQELQGDLMRIQAEAQSKSQLVEQQAINKHAEALARQPTF